MILLAAFWENPTIVGLILLIPGTVLGYLGLRLSRARDAVVKEEGASSGQVAWAGLVYQDNTALREEVKELRKIVEAIQDRLDVVEAGSTDLRAENLALKRENGLLHSENDAMKLEIGTLKDRISELETRANGS